MKQGLLPWGGRCLAQQLRSCCCNSSEKNSLLLLHNTRWFECFQTCVWSPSRPLPWSRCLAQVSLCGFDHWVSVGEENWEIRTVMFCFFYFWWPLMWHWCQCCDSTYLGCVADVMYNFTYVLYDSGIVFSAVVPELRWRKPTHSSKMTDNLKGLGWRYLTFFFLSTNPGKDQNEQLIDSSQSLVWFIPLCHTSPSFSENYEKHINVHYDKHGHCSLFSLSSTCTILLLHTHQSSCSHCSYRYVNLNR